MKLAVTGKGGVGKTTVCALLARAFADAGRRVIAVDADPNATLAACLGFDDPDSITPLIEMEALIEERTGVKPGSQGAVFKLNPRVEDIPDRFCTTKDGVRLLKMGALKRGGSGCYCPENAFLKSLVSHLFLVDQDVLIMDMEAGIEHFGRGTAQGVDWLLVVVEPSRQSIDTAKRIKSLAEDIGLARIGVIGNKCRTENEREFIERSVSPLPLLGALPYDDGLRLAEQEGRPPEPSRAAVSEEVQRIIAQLENEQIVKRTLS
ncbi:MAG: carbon monoxide dehydrogenase accessory protein CooC [Armatimonadetes bacterium]|nr:carbon monoxide dehydrogenase accessory protein CooC [Armatimonadota bacterium]